MKTAIILMLAAAAGAQADDTYLPWEGGPAYYSKWQNGPSADPNYFPIAVWLQDPANAKEYKQIGVNLFIGLWRGPNDAQLQTLEEAGMPVLAGQRPTAISSAHAAIIRGWALQDEPDNAQAKRGGGWGSCILPPEVQGWYAKTRAADPTRPVYLNVGQAVINEPWPGRGEACGGHYEHYPEYIKATDIISYDVYPVNNKLPLWWVGAGVDRLRKWADYKKPVWNWLETTAYNGGRKPTPDEIRAEVWISLIHGSMGIGYFCHQFKPSEDSARPLHDTETREALARINRQIAELAPVLNTPSVANGVVATSKGQIDTMLKRQGGATYLFAVGARPGGETTATFKLRDCGNLKAEVLGESRSVPVTKGVFTDRFREYEVHLYRLPFNPNPR